MRRWPKVGRSSSFLNGLDEVGNLQDRQTVMHEIEAALKVWQVTGNRVVLTSRIVGYQFRPLTRLAHYIVAEMDHPAITAFCSAWMRHVAPADAEAQAQKLAAAITNDIHPGVRVLAGNPLLLTILAQVYRAKQTLPKSRSELFDQAAAAFYAQRRAYWSDLTAPELSRALAAVAAYLHAEEVTGFTDERSVRYQLGTVLDKTSQITTVLVAAREVSGFLVEHSGGGVYGFLHRAVQEYFAARFLVDEHETVPPDLRLERLRAHVLDPTWREPLVLAVAHVSQKDYLDAPHMPLLRQVFATLLDTPDPAGAVLPRRELLAAAACAECERIPPGVVAPLTKRLLAFAARRDGRAVAPQLHQRIKQALKNLRASPAHADAVTGVCAVINDPSFERRYAAVDLVITLEWDDPAIVTALLTAWQTYPDPAAMLLTALEAIHTRQPAWFTPKLLPFRQAVEREPQLWAQACGSEPWQQVIRLLYLAPGAAFEPDQISRDSLLTPQVLTALRQPDADAALTRLGDDLLPIARQTGTASARDAALLLSATGDTRWVAEQVAQSDPHGASLRPIAAVLARPHHPHPQRPSARAGALKPASGVAALE